MNPAVKFKNKKNPDFLIDKPIRDVQYFRVEIKLMEHLCESCS